MFGSYFNQLYWDSYFPGCMVEKWVLLVLSLLVLGVVPLCLMTLSEQTTGTVALEAAVGAAPGGEATTKDLQLETSPVRPLDAGIVVVL